jgi:toxin ParE1/3/4
MFKVSRSAHYLEALHTIVRYIAQDNIIAALELEERIESQVSQLADPKFPRRKGRVKGTHELVAHANYIVLLKQTATEVLAYDVVHVARRFP